MANNDLDKYGKALDKYVCLGQEPLDMTYANLFTLSAIMKFHSLKMEEINATISHLWTKTYQGSGQSPVPAHFLSFYLTCTCRHRYNQD